MKPGRNDPCPCGSGKKYKHCCQRAQAQAPEHAEDLVWRRQQRLNEEFQRDIPRFIRRTYGAHAIAEAGAEFMLWEDGEMVDADSLHLPLFMPWFFHRWTPDPADTEVADTSLHEVAPTSAYLAARSQRLDAQLREYLESCLSSPFSFYEILDTEPGHGCRLRDVLLGSEHVVIERSASATLEVGDLLFAQLASVGGRTLLEACAPVAFPPIHRIQIIELRERLQANDGVLTPERLLDWDVELRECYLDIADTILDPQRPTLFNSDGDAFGLQTLVFEIESAAAAFAALKHLALVADTTEAELLSEATYDQNGALSNVSLPWLCPSADQPGPRDHGLDNTILGFIEIDDRRLEINVNSDARAVAARALVESALGPQARYQVTLMTSTERLLDDALERSDEAHDVSEDDLLALPEVQAKLNEMREAHYARWVDEPVPALDDQTPKEAMKTPAGREKVAALMAQFERDRLSESPPMDPGILTRLRARLGLDT